MFNLFKKKYIIVSPMDGEAIDIAGTSDPVFAQKMVGDGITIIPKDGTVVSPVDGEIIQLFDTGHAIAIRSTQDDVEILIHIGIDTVELNGDGFDKHVKLGDKVNKGDLLITANLETIKSKGKSTETPVVIVNASNKSIVKTTGNVSRGISTIIELK